MPAAANKDVVRAFYAEAIGGRDPSAVDRMLSEGFVHNGEPRGRDGQRAAVEYLLAAFADLRNEIELILAEGELVAAHQRWSGTHSGEFLGVQATNRRIEFTSTAVLRLEAGMIAEAWDEVDMLGVLRQLEAPPDG